MDLTDILEKPLRLFRIFIVMRIKVVRNLKKMTKLLDADPRLRKLCLIKPGEEQLIQETF
jgi:hypothetical protein